MPGKANPQVPQTEELWENHASYWDLEMPQQIGCRVLPHAGMKVSCFVSHTAALGQLTWLVYMLVASSWERFLDAWSGCRSYTDVGLLPKVAASLGNSGEVLHDSVPGAGGQQRYE
eukprot:3633620-Amphidinium_carterae.1